ncbi:hypothetical protein ASPBRDRAFT_240847 [Aspergillus brasiliensis CBS 101740]|uniref:Uncharacterized protein n=1 Tax=Aspergillus brasiliensis (strain CBS 101740 / IMI 381727 / IBT 21946) TaxID=767769 RepID=A0A1L9V0X3_ASPBC|nr:hypothetical protein ASPBRDRAFT_240847 [Aspergillus brasiliensis CBS 101740]
MTHRGLRRPTGRPQSCGSSPVVPGTVNIRAVMAKKPGAKSVCQPRRTPGEEGDVRVRPRGRTSAREIQLDGRTTELSTRMKRGFAMAMGYQGQPSLRFLDRPSSGQTGNIGD